MTERIWDKFLTARDKEVFAASGYGANAGFGKRPVLLVIDVNYGFVGDRPEPILESIKRWPNSCGEDGWAAVPVIRRLIDQAHNQGIPVIYTTGRTRPDRWDRGSWSWKNSRTSQALAPQRKSNLDPNTIIPELAPAAHDIVIDKRKPSGFFGTDLQSFLTLLQADSLVLTGTTTSGCVRATAIDAFSLNYRVAIVEDGCFDRSQASHAINLCDMNAKYADVIASEDVLRFFTTLPSGLFELPSGRI
ncbi:MAG: isochorismatase family protein [Alphaproteobacteria bacterium]|nr:isochorismatase family protein [Alphaproteobacteria bacterium]